MELPTQHARHLSHFHKQGFLPTSRRSASLWSNLAQEDLELVLSWGGWGCRHDPEPRGLQPRAREDWVVARAAGQ